MNFAQLDSFLPLIVAAAYTILFIVLVARNNQRSQQTRYFFGFLTVAVLWELTLYITVPPAFLPNIPLKALIGGTTVLGATTAAYLSLPGERHWLYLGGGSILLAAALDLVMPRPVLPAAANASLRPTVGGLFGLLTWIGLNIAIVVETWRGYRRARLPWHANRLLHWVVFAFATAAGQFLTMVADSWLAAAGQLLCFVGIVGLTRAIVSHRLFDVRARLRKAFGSVFILLASAVLAAVALGVALGFATRIELQPSHFSVVFMVVMTVSFLYYHKLRHVMDRIVDRYLVGQEFHTSHVARRYSQATARTLDVEQLAQVIIGTVAELLQITRGALMLVSRTGEGYEVEAIPSQHHHLHQCKVFAADSRFIDALVNGRQPLLQYDIDFNPIYENLDKGEREWLTEQGMEVYFPIYNGDGLAGLIALGPKRSGHAYRPNELELVQVLAEQTVIALQNARLYSELNQQNDRIRHLNADLRKQNERLEILDRIKSDFITIASHELRTPLTQVKGYADILTSMNEEAKLTQKETREIVAHISRAASRLETLITAMLDASQLEVSGMQLSFMRTRVEVIIQLAIETIIHAVHRRHIHLELHGLGDLPPIQADFKRLVQAFHNIIVNAVKYTPDYGTISISAAVVPGADGENDYVEVIVADGGIGIDAQYHELIFEKFFRIGNPELHSTGSTKFKGAGPGLGLHIAKGVIEAHGGRVWVESEGEDEERLHGSRFHIILPLHPPAARDDSELAGPTAQESPEPQLDQQRQQQPVRITP